MLEVSDPNESPSPMNVLIINPVISKCSCCEFLEAVTMDAEKVYPAVNARVSLRNIKIASFSKRTGKLFLGWTLQNNIKIGKTNLASPNKSNDFFL